MKKINIIVSFLFSITIYSQDIVIATVYHAVENQTNSDPSHTASMFSLDLSNPYKHRIIAISRNLLDNKFKMGDKVMITGAGKYSGIWIINDKMNKRYTDTVDFLINVGMPIGKWHDVKIEKI
jgi:hypothetical protein